MSLLHCSKMLESAANTNLLLKPVLVVTQEGKLKGTSLPAQTNYCHRCSMCFEMSLSYAIFFFKEHFNGLNPSGTLKSVIFLDYFV